MTGLARVRETFVPETATEDTVLAVELTLTVKAEAAGTTFARVMLKVISRTYGVAFAIRELT